MHFERQKQMKKENSKQIKLLKPIQVLTGWMLISGISW